MINRVVFNTNPLVVKYTNYTWKNTNDAVYFNISIENLLEVAKFTVIIDSLYSLFKF